MGRDGQAKSVAVERWHVVGNLVRASVRVSRLALLRDKLSTLYVDWKDLEEQKVVGKGAFATVIKCIYTSPTTGQELVVAVKQIRSNLLGDSKEVHLFVEEAKLLSTLNHRYARLRLAARNHADTAGVAMPGMACNGAGTSTLRAARASCQPLTCSMASTRIAMPDEQAGQH